MKKIKDVLSLIRMHQWLKNVFVFLPLLFGGRIFNHIELITVCVISLSFCLVSSSIYCLNDIIDVNADRQHPKKKDRAIASGRISIFAAVVLIIICLTLGLCLPILYNNCIQPMQNLLFVYAVLCFYYILNICYCLKLKQIAIIDVFIIAIGFVLRVFIGGIPIGVEISSWIVLMTFLLALFLAFAKRRDDMVLYINTKKIIRSNIRSYSKEFLDQVITIIATLSIVCYLMYCMDEQTVQRLGSSIYVSMIFVLAGFIRYLQITIVRENSGSPTKILMRDKFMILCVISWIATFFAIIYLEKILILL